MAEQYIQIPPNSTGTKMRTQEVSVSGNTVDMENVVLTGSDGTMATVTAGNALKVDASSVAVPVTDNAGSLTVDGTVTVNAGTNLNTSALQLDATGAALNLAQASTTSGQTGPLLQTATTTNAPTYTTAKTNPISTDVSGNIRVSLKDSPANTNKFLVTPDLPSGASTAAKQPALGTAGSASTDVITVQGIASMTKLLVTPDSVALPANQSVNVAQINAVTPLMGAGNTGTGSPRVTIASDQTVIPVSDNSGSITVDNAGTFAVQATVAAAAANIAKAEDVASADADVGVPAMAIRKATPANTSGTDGDYEMLQMSAGRLWVDPSGVTLTVGSHAVTNAGTFATQSAITAASGSIASGAIASGAIASGAVASGAVTSGAFASGSISAGAVAAGATSFVKLEDVASADADAGVPSMAIQKATPADTAGTDGDYAMLQMSAGRLWTTSNVDKIAGTAAVTAGVSGMLAVGGNTATNVAITANPVLQGAQAVSSENAVATTSRGVQLVADLVGKQIVLPYANPENFVVGVTAAITDTTSTSTIASQGGSIRTYITSILVTNSHATVGTFVKILDGATIIWEGYAAAAGGGFSCQFPVPLRGTAATAVNTQCVTTGANVISSVAGYKGV